MLDQIMPRILKCAQELNLFHDTYTFYTVSSGAFEASTKLRSRQNLKEYIYLLWLYVPFRLVMGGPQLFPYLAAMGLFGLHDCSKIAIKNHNLTSMPERLLISCHHRRNCTEPFFNDLLLQYIVSDFYKNHACVYNFGSKPSEFMKYVHKKIWRGHSLLQYDDPDSKFQYIVDLASRPNSMTCVFSDRDGSQFYEDYEIAFRPGLFAASIYLEVPILDICISYGTPTNNQIDIELKLWIPPKASQDCMVHDSYKGFRELNKNLINQFVIDCETDYLNRLKTLNDAKLCCGPDGELKCKPDKISLKGHLRNLKAREYRGSQS